MGKIRVDGAVADTFWYWAKLLVPASKAASNANKTLAFFTFKKSFLKAAAYGTIFAGFHPTTFLFKGISADHLSGN
jgi:hypothetical protein